MTLRPYSDEVLEEIKRELAFIWAAHKVLHLDGKMRAFTPRSQGYWQSHEPGLEVWFGPAEIGKVIDKIKVFYQRGTPPNSPLFLDPVVYQIAADNPVPQPVGSGIAWCTVLCEKDEDVISEDALRRIKDLRVSASPVFYASNEGGKTRAQSGLKMLAFLKEPAMPSGKHDPDGNMIHNCQDIADLVDTAGKGPYVRYYMLSGLAYNTKHGRYQHAAFPDVFGSEPVTSVREIATRNIHPNKLRDAAVCWNAYDRDQVLYSRYGVDVANLKNNLKAKEESDRRVEAVTRELQLIWQAQRRHGLTGKMRLYTAPTQENWRAKEAGLVVWFGPDELDRAVRKLRFHYNAGVLPNSPMLLDPVVYQEEEGGVHVPVGTGVIWSTALATGLAVFDETALGRLHDLKLLTGPFLRAGQKNSGVKVLGFLDKPYLFSEEEKAAWRAAGKEAEGQKEKDAAHPSAANGAAADALGIAACGALFNLTNCNAEQFWKYYLLTGLEYLCTNGAFENRGFDEPLGATDEDRAAVIARHTMPLQTVLDAAACWDEYDRHPSLWEQFGVDLANLEENLRYFRLCGRDFELLSSTNASTRKEVEETFEFLVPGWIPRGGVTLVAASNGTGRGSLVHRLAVTVATDWKDGEKPPPWLGSEVNLRHAAGLAVYFSGEDTAPIVAARAKIYDPEKRSKRLLTKYMDFGRNEHGERVNFSEFLERLDKLPDISLVVVDSARKYLNGDENSPEVVGTFFDRLDRLAVKHGCPVVVVHDLIKGAAPRRSRDVFECLRGSDLFADRPRVIIGMVREESYVVAGLAKNSIPSKFGMVEGERVFARDPATVELVWLPGEQGVRGAALSEREIAQAREGGKEE